MQPNNPIDPSNQPQPAPGPAPVPPQAPAEPQQQPAQSYQSAPYGAPAAPQQPQAAPAPQPFAPQGPAPVPAPGATPPAGPVFGSPAPAGPPTPGSKLKDFIAKLNKKALIKIGIIAGIVILLLVAVFVGARFLPSNPVTNFITGTKGINLKEYTNSDIGFSMNVPEDWIVDADTDSEYYKSVDFKEPAADLEDDSEAAKQTATISVRQSDNSTSEYLKVDETDYFDTAKKSIKAGLDAADESDDIDFPQKLEIISDEDTTINGLKAYVVKVKVTNYRYEEGDKGFGTFAYIYVNEDFQYAVSMGAHEADKGAIDKFDAIVKSFKSTK